MAPAITLPSGSGEVPRKYKSNFRRTQVSSFLQLALIQNRSVYGVILFLLLFGWFLFLPPPSRLPPPPSSSSSSLGSPPTTRPSPSSSFSFSFFFLCYTSLVDACVGEVQGLKRVAWAVWCSGIYEVGAEEESLSCLLIRAFSIPSFALSLSSPLFQYRSP